MSATLPPTGNRPRLRRFGKARGAHDGRYDEKRQCVVDKERSRHDEGERGEDEEARCDAVPLTGSRIALPISKLKLVPSALNGSTLVIPGPRKLATSRVGRRRPEDQGLR